MAAGDNEGANDKASLSLQALLAFEYESAGLRLCLFF